MNNGFLNRLKIFGRSVSRGAETRSRPTAPLEIVIGIDYGTRFTKIAIGREGVETAIWRDARGRRLIPSILHVAHNGDVLPWPDDPPSGAVRVEYLKMLLTRHDKLAFGSVPAALQRDEMLQVLKALAASFLSEVIRRVRESEEKKPYIKSENTRWLVNIGLPVQYYDAPEREVFQEIASVAFHWHQKHMPVRTIDSLVSAYSAALADNANAPAPTSVFPELAAALTEYIRDPNRPEGLYGFCDVGGGTIDGAIFRLNRDSGLPRLAIPSAAVAPFGAAAIARSLVGRSGLPSSETNDAALSEKLEARLIASKLLSSAASDPVAQIILAHDAKPRNTVQTFVRTFVNEARLKRNVNGHTYRDPYSGEKIELRLFLAGGGADSAWYRSVIQGVDPEKNQAFDGIRKVQLETVSRPPHFREQDFPRFVVALGLANSPDILEANSKCLPSSILRKTPPPEHTPTPLITKDQV